MPVDPKIQSSVSFPFAEYLDSGINNAAAQAFSDKILTAPKQVQQSLLRNIRGSSGLGGGFGTGGTASQNWHTTTVASRPFVGVEVVYSNPTGASVTYDATAVAASSSLASAASKSTPDQPWTASGPVVIDTVGTNILPALKGTGIIPCRSVPRTDGGKYPLIHVRTYTAAVLAGYFNLTNLANNWETYNPDWPFQAFVQGASNWTASNWAFFTSLTRIGITVPAALRFIYDTQGYTCLGNGDSIIGGDSVVDGSPQRMSYGFRAARILQDQGLSFDFINGGISGNTWAQYAPRAKVMMDFYKPDSCLIPSFTPNDPIASQADAETQWRNAMDLVVYAQNAGIVPIVITPAPNNAFSLTTDPYRLSLRDRAKASKLWVLDVEGAWGDGASPTRWKAGMNDAGNSTHPGGPGNQVIAGGLADLWKQMFFS